MKGKVNNCRDKPHAYAAISLKCQVLTVESIPSTMKGIGRGSAEIGTRLVLDRFDGQPYCSGRRICYAPSQ
jgi:hypothetical protein